MVLDKILEDVKVVDIFLKFISNVDIKDGKSIFIIAVIMCMFFVLFQKAIYASSIEILFMNDRKKNCNDFLGLLAVLALFTLSNRIVMMYLSNVEVGVIGGASLVFFLFRFIRYSWSIRKIRKCEIDIKRLMTYYMEKRYDSVTYICIIVNIVFIYYTRSDGNAWSYAIIGGLLEVTVLIFLGSIKRGKCTSNYFVENDEKYYIYNQMRKNRFLCGDTAEVDNATWYSIVEMDKIKDKRIYHEIYHAFSKQEKKDLIKRCKNNLKDQRQKKQEKK